MLRNPGKKSFWEKLFAEMEIVTEEVKRDFRAGVYEIVIFNCKKKASITVGGHFQAQLKVDFENGKNIFFERNLGVLSQ